MLTRRHLGHMFNAGIVSGLAAAVMVTGATQKVPLGGWVGDPSPSVTRKPVNAPAWSPDLAQEFKGYSDVSRIPREPSSWPRSALVVGQDGDVLEMEPSEVWRRGHNQNRADDVWVVGLRH